MIWLRLNRRARLRAISPRRYKAGTSTRPMSPLPDRSKVGWEELIGTIMPFFIDEGS
jgi:hypothetical protein